MHVTCDDTVTQYVYDTYVRSPAARTPPRKINLSYIYCIINIVDLDIIVNCPNVRSSARICSIMHVYNIIILYLYYYYMIVSICS